MSWARLFRWDEARGRWEPTGACEATPTSVGDTALMAVRPRHLWHRTFGLRPEATRTADELGLVVTHDHVGPAGRVVGRLGPV